ncbi:MAG: ribonuclease P protein component [Oscillospiraceae bacterium]
MLHTIMLNQNSDFRRLYYRGKSRNHPFIITYARKNNLGKNRIGITTSKKIGKAHSRNRAKRIIREAYRLNENIVPLGWDFVFVARTVTTTLNMNDIRPIMASHIEFLTQEKKNNNNKQDLQ